jgi:hypothetical protein
LIRIQHGLCHLKPNSLNLRENIEAVSIDKHDKHALAYQLAAFVSRILSWLRTLSGGYQLPLQPASNGLIIELEGGTRQGNAQKQDQHANGKSLCQRYVMVVYPGRVEVDQGIMRDVDRVGNIPQELTDAGG